MSNWKKKEKKAKRWPLIHEKNILREQGQPLVYFIPGKSTPIYLPENFSTISLSEIAEYEADEDEDENDFLTDADKVNISNNNTSRDDIFILQFHPHTELHPDHGGPDTKASRYANKIVNNLDLDINRLINIICKASEQVEEHRRQQREIDREERKR